MSMHSNTAEQLPQSSREQMLKWILLSMFLFLLVMNAFSPKEKGKVKIDLESIRYEAKKLVTQDEKTTLIFPSQNLDDVRNYLQGLPDLKFKPYTKDKLPGTWRLLGASMIDYRVAQMTVSAYENLQSDGKVYLFSLPAHKDTFSYGGIQWLEKEKYLLYGSSDINLVLWKEGERTLHILAGWESAKTLISFLKN